MKKFTLFRFGRCYLNKAGDMAVSLVRGNKQKGYQFKGSHNNRLLLINKFQLQSRVVANDGNWHEIDEPLFKLVSALHSAGHSLPLADL
jgi:hypothetical protein